MKNFLFIALISLIISIGTISLMVVLCDPTEQEPILYDVSPSLEKQSTNIC